MSSKRKHLWFGRGTPPSGLNDRSTWSYSIEDDPPWTISIQTLIPKPKGLSKLTPAKPPPKGDLSNPPKKTEPGPAKAADKQPPQKANLTKEDSSQPFVDKPGDASRERSRSPARADSNSGAKASSPPAPVIGTVDKQSPPADVDDALLQGWSEEDYGGNGDCVFRAIKAHIALESGQPKLDEAQAKSQGALLRAEALQHIRKHADRFENYWAPPVKALTQDPPPTFQGWLKKAGKQSTYANGVFLQALAERLGSVLIIWRKTANSWERYTVAGRFGSNGIACKSTEGHIINLCLKNEHYTLLRKPAEGTVPEAWLREPVSTIVDLTGGGGGGDSREVSGFSSSPFSAQSLSRLSLPPSPSLHTLPACSDLADSDLCRDPVTPSVHSRASVDPRPGLEHPPPTPSVHTLRRVRGKSSVHFPASVDRVAGSPSVPSVHSRASVGLRPGPEFPPTPSVHTLPARSDPNEHEAKRARTTRDTVSAPSSIVLGGEAAHSWSREDNPASTRRESGKAGSWHRTPIGELWWTCHIPDCGFQVYKVPKLSTHNDTRRQHLLEKHGLSLKDVPQMERSTNKADLSLFFSKKFDCLVSLFSARPWAGMHKLYRHEVIPKKKAVWKCSQCHAEVPNRRVPSEICSAYRGSPKAIPSLAQRKRQWKVWGNEAAAKARLDPKDVALKRKRDRVQLKCAKQAKWDEEQTAQPQNPMRRYNVVPSSKPVDSVWWKCPWCSYKIFPSMQGRPSWLKSTHLKRAHNLKNSPLPNTDLSKQPHRLANCKSALDARWLRLHSLITIPPWPGAHTLLKDPAYHRSYRNKDGGTWYKAMYQCKVCNFHVALNEFAQSTCRLADASPPSLTDRKQKWKELRAQAAKPKRPRCNSGKVSDKPASASCGRAATAADEATEKVSCGQAATASDKSTKHVPGGRAATISGVRKNAPMSKQVRGMASTGRGLRGVRVGEARHPGPSSRTRSFEKIQQHLQIWSCNIRSFTKHSKELMRAATEAGIGIMCLQETNISQAAFPSAQHSALRAGWYMLHTPPGDSKKLGGVGILLREPWTAKRLFEFQDKTGQLLVLEATDGNRTIHVGSAYRSPGSDWAFIHKFTEYVAAHPSTDWILGMDTNSNVLDGPISQLISSQGGGLRAAAKHDRSQHYIDGVWSSAGLQAVASYDDVPGPSDHSVAHAVLNIKPHKGPQKFRFAKPRDPGFDPVGSVDFDFWDHVATSKAEWSASFSDIDQAFHLWCSDVEKWLNHVLPPPSKEPERSLGSEPRTLHSTSRMGIAQSIEERQLRRHLRRLKECKTLAWKGRRPDRQLFRHLLSPLIPDDEKLLIRQGLWGPAINKSTARLDTLLYTSKTEALSRWKQRVHTLSGASRWLKQEEQVALAVKNEEGRVISSTAAAVETLRDFWRPVFGTPDAAVDPELFLDHYREYLPEPTQCPEVPEITLQDLRREIRAMRGKATGLDGVSPDILGGLPDAALTRLIELFELFEQKQAWPQTLVHWRIVMLPKVKDGDFCSVSNTRPIAVGPVLYRLWGKLRMKTLAPWLAQFTHPMQAGGVGGQDAETLTLSLEMLYPEQDFPFWCGLDYKKAFDSLDFSIPLRILKFLGLPPQIHGLLQHQWTNHKRWIAFGGAAAKSPLTGCQGLPQGDVFSPIALALTLRPVLERVNVLVPHSHTFLYLDDRSIVAKSMEALTQAQTVWDELETFTRLRTSPPKTQLFARTWDVYGDLVSQGLRPEVTADTLGISLRLPSCTGNTKKEAQRERKFSTAALRLALLPVSLRLRSTLAALCLAPLKTWGGLLNQRLPTKSTCKDYASKLRAAVKGSDSPGDHSDRHLQRILLLGHHSDLLFMHAQRTLRALNRWVGFAQRFGWPLPVSSTPTLSLLDSALSSWHIQSTPQWGTWSWPSGRWSITEPLQAPHFAHLLRSQWRRCEFQSWLSSTRNDASVARSVGLEISHQFIDRLHNQTHDLDGDSLAVACGGFHTDAHFIPGAAPARDFCYDCGDPVAPHTIHLFWHCRAFLHLRTLPAPPCPLLCRLGWNSVGIDPPILRQMGEIRKAANASSRKRRSPNFSGEADLGGAGGGGGLRLLGQ